MLFGFMASLLRRRRAARRFARRSSTSRGWRARMELGAGGFGRVAPPYQSAKRSGSVHSRQTSSRGASNVQPISIAGSRLSPDVSATGGLPRSVLQTLVHPLEAVLPEAPVALDPVRGLLQTSALEVGGTKPRDLSPGDQPSALQHLEVLGDRLDRDGEALGELGQRCVAAAQPVQDLPTGRVSEGGERAIELSRRHGAALNQMVEWRERSQCDR